MQTMKDHLSQRIFEIPDKAREVFCSIELSKDLAQTLELASNLIKIKLNYEDAEHPITMFVSDRIEDLTTQILSTIDDKVIISTDVDTISFFIFACEQLNQQDITETKKLLNNEVNIALTALLASILIDC